MRHITMATLVSAGLTIASAPLIAADAVRSETLSVRAVKPSSASDADVLAERHLALYRASQQLPTVTSEAASESDGDMTQVVVRSSATAALPLPRRVPSPHEADGR